MRIGLETRGRPRYIADYTYTNTLVQLWYDQFYQACQTLTYREMLALSRLLGLSLRTIYRWKHNERFPRNIERVLVVIDWTRRGKPIKLESQADVAAQRVMW